MSAWTTTVCPSLTCCCEHFRPLTLLNSSCIFCCEQRYVPPLPASSKLSFTCSRPAAAAATVFSCQSQHLISKNSRGPDTLGGGVTTAVGRRFSPRLGIDWSLEFAS